MRVSWLGEVAAVLTLGAWSVSCGGRAGGADATETADTGGECEVGGQGCRCTDGGACDPGLQCIEDYCVNPDCLVGSQGCPCTGGGACDPGLECNGGFCVDPGGASTTGSTTSPTSPTTDPSTTSGPSTTDPSTTDPSTSTDDGSTSAVDSTTSGDTTGVDTTGGDTTTTTTGTTTTSSSTTTGGGFCGDGEIDIGEECDDGNAVDGDGCNNDCTESGKLLWSTTISTAYGLDDEGHGVAEDSLGNIYATGHVKTPGPNSALDIWVGKFTSDGAKIWEKTYDGAGPTYDFDIGWDIAIDSNDQAIVAGSSDAGGVEELNIWMRKYTAGGNTVWTVEEHFGVQEQGRGIVVTPNDQIILAGYVSTPQPSGWARRYTSDGMPIWTETFQVLGNAYGQSIALGPNDEFAMVGNGGAKWLRKYDSVPNEMWSLWEGGCQELYGVAIDGTGDVFAAGCNSGTVWLKKLDGANGNEIWSDLNYQGVQQLNAIAFGAAVDPLGNVVITGQEGTNNQASNVFVRKYSADGTLYWSRTYNGAANGIDAGWNVSVAANGDTLVIGWETVLNEGKNIWLARYSL